MTCGDRVGSAHAVAPDPIELPRDAGTPRFAPRMSPSADLSHPAMSVNLDACIQCTRCVRACREVQVNDVIGYAFRGEHAKIVKDLEERAS